MTIFSYLSGKKFSSLLCQTAILARKSNRKLIIIIDEGESLLNLFHTSLVVGRPFDKKFNTNMKVNILSAIAGSKNQLLFNTNHNLKNEVCMIICHILANPPMANTFEKFAFVLPDEKTINKGALKGLFSSKNPVYDDFTVFRNVESVTVVS
jgi:hypothetical protein